MKTWVILPHQCFPIEEVRPWMKDVDRILLWEDPVFYGDRRGAPGVAHLRLHFLRIVLQRVLFRTYLQRLRAAHLAPRVDLVPVEDLWGRGTSAIYGSWKKEDIWMFDPCDHLFMQRITGAPAGIHPHVVSSPAFVLSMEDLSAYRATLARKKAKRLAQAPFFAYVKQRVGILVDQPSLDAQNRQPFPKEAARPPLPYAPKGNGVGVSAWKEAYAWAAHHPFFKDNPGRMEEGKEDKESISKSFLHFVATNSEQARAWLRRFLHHRFALFGTYEDAIVPDAPWLYHSGLSMALNFGLLTPREVVEEVRRHYERLPAALQKSQLASYEGFVRQLLGWREYCRLYYLHVPPKIYRRNVFRARSRPLSRLWYRAPGMDTGAEASRRLPSPVQDAIRDAWRDGYLHHIRRLMVVANYMMLTGVHPDRMYQWFYEFSLDSWDWVMVFNVYSMGSWSDGGYGMRKPYISSSTYLRRMARAPAAGAWQKTWDDLFHTFVQKHAKVLRHTALAALLKEPKN